MGTPEGFIIPSNYQGASSGVATAFVGSNGGQPYRFFFDEVYNPKESEEQGVEVKKTIEMVEFIVDYKTKFCHRIDPHLFKNHPEILKDYQLWKEGRKSNVTPVVEWEAIGYGDMGMLISAGFVTVEQIAEADRDRALQMGMGWADLWSKAKQHVATKNKATDDAQLAGEARTLKEAMSQKDQELAELRAMIMEMKDKQEKVTLESAVEVKTPTRKPGIQSKK